MIPLAFVGRHWIEVERNARGQLMGLGLVDSERRSAARAFEVLVDDSL